MTDTSNTPDCPLRRRGWVHSLNRCIAATLTALPVAAVCDGPIDVVFARDAWQRDKWILVKSPRWPHKGDWVQKDDAIENTTPTDAAPADLLGKRASETYTSMVLKERFHGNVDIRTVMLFQHRMAPLIVIAPELGKDADGTPEYREHWEVVLFDKGVNVWHHNYKDGKPGWKEAAFARFDLKPGEKHEVAVAIRHGKRGKTLQVTVNGKYTFGYLDDSLPDTYHVGITGCEGVNRFYRFSAQSR